MSCNFRVGYAVVVGMFCLLSSIATSSEPGAVVITRQGGRVERFSQFELDVASRKQALEDAKAFDPENKFNVCCAVLSRDVEMLSLVFDHFRKNIGDTKNYGAFVQESETYYIVHFWEKYRESTQKQIHGYWKPSISYDLREYAYLVNRDTLEILEVNKKPM